MTFKHILALSSVVVVASAADPCSVIAGQKWVAPAALRACFQSFKVNETERTNILDVITKTLPFHTSTNYQIQAPPPFHNDVHEDILGDLARIKKQRYASDYDLHIDLSRSERRLNDGHCVWINSCYDSAYLNYLPIPLVLLTDSRGLQSVTIAPAAFSVASAEFPDQIDVWQNALPGKLKGKLESLNGAKVLLINGLDPWFAINDNAAIAGSYQSYGTRQNGFFSSYSRTATGWNYILGNFAQQALPLADNVDLLLQLTNTTLPVAVRLPYRARVNGARAFTDGPSYRAANCRALASTNGVDIYAETPSEAAADRFRQAPPSPSRDSRKHPLNVILDDTPLTDVVLPVELTPVSPVNGSFGVGQFYLLEDKKTGVLALGSFSGNAYEVMMQGLLDGLLSLKSLGATQLVVDITNNGGGYICVAHWLHRILVGPKKTTVPNAGLYTKARAGPLAQLIVDSIIQNNTDPENGLLYNPQGWRNINDEFFEATEDWLTPVPVTINGRKDAFTALLGQECQPEGFTTAPPTTALFDASKIVIVGNGRCASSCSLFSITMHKAEGTRTVVVGGRKETPQKYCGIVGGQSTSFTTIDTEIKTTKLKGHALAPPDLIVPGVQGITWRLGFGIDNPKAPEEWQDQPATLNLPLTAELANNPPAIWKEVAKRLF